MAFVVIAAIINTEGFIFIFALAVSLSSATKNPYYNYSYKIKPLVGVWL